MATSVYAANRALQAIYDGERDLEATQPLPVLPGDLPDENDNGPRVPVLPCLLRPQAG
jgi:hypothetical protein